MGKLTIKDILHAAIAMEETGQRFYNKLAEITQDEAIKSFLKETANQENMHAKFYKDMLKKIVQAEEDNLEKSIPAEKRSAYKKAVDAVQESVTQVEKLQKTIFTKQAVQKFLTIKDLAQVVNSLIEIEESSVDLFTELEESTAVEHRDKLRLICNEEKAHLKALMLLKNRIAEGE